MNEELVSALYSMCRQADNMCTAMQQLAIAMHSMEEQSLANARFYKDRQEELREMIGYLCTELHEYNENHKPASEKTPQ